MLYFIIIIRHTLAGVSYLFGGFFYSCWGLFSDQIFSYFQRPLKMAFNGDKANLGLFSAGAFFVRKAIMTLSPLAFVSIAITVLLFKIKIKNVGVSNSVEKPLVMVSLSMCLCLILIDPWMCFPLLYSAGMYISQQYEWGKINGKFPLIIGLMLKFAHDFAYAHVLNQPLCAVAFMCESILATVFIIRSSSQTDEERLRSLLGILSSVPISVAILL